MGFVGVEPKKGQIVIDEVLGDDARDDGLADAALFPANEVQSSHKGRLSHGPPLRPVGPRRKVSAADRQADSSTETRKKV